MPARLFTIGHSTRSIDDFLELLGRHAIEVLVDIRTMPGSRRNPQFGQESLRQSLQEAGIDYLHMKNLGGLRRVAKDSINMGWRNESFRGFADYMQTAEFQAAIESLVEIAAERRTAIMCAEAVPWRCHRSLVGDALLVRGLEVMDIISESSSRLHGLTPFAQVEGKTITYP